MAITRKQPRLGRGLSSLIGQPVQVSPAPPLQPQTLPDPAQILSALPKATPAGADLILHIPIDAIRPNPHQPRQHFDQASLQQLAESIRVAGVMQPILVRGLADSRRGQTPTYELVAGERRWRAAKLAGLSTVPAIARSADDSHLAEWALIENRQREDLNPIERAHAFQQLADRFSLSHEQVAQRVGLDRSSVTNSLRLLSLSTAVQQLVIDGLVSAGHARAIAAIQDHEVQANVARQAVRRQWSVRQVEAEIRRITDGAGTPHHGTATKPRAHLSDLEAQMAQQLGSRVRIRPGRKKGTGTLMIDFQSLDEFDAILARLKVKAE
jgi:ParB family transcriptional regulator, chromosome partitioning protein